MMGIVVGAVLLLVGGCGGSDGAEASTDPTETTRSPIADDAPESGLAATTVVQQELVPLGVSANVGEGWHLTVDAVDFHAASAARQLGEPPAIGEAFVLLDITLDYKGLDENGSPPALVAMELVGDDGARHDEWCNISMDRQLEYQTLLLNGESISGQVCYRFPTEQLDSVVLVASATWPGERGEKTFALG
jgi:hypothetical protein